MAKDWPDRKELIEPPGSIGDMASDGVIWGLQGTSQNARFTPNNGHRQRKNG